MYKFTYKLTLKQEANNQIVRLTSTPLVRFHFDEWNENLLYEKQEKKKAENAHIPWFKKSEN